MTRFRDTRGEKKTKQERILDKIDKLIEKYEDNVAGPYWINREQKRKLMKTARMFKKERYKLTEEDKKRLENQRAKV